MSILEMRRAAIKTRSPSIIGLLGRLGLEPSSAHYNYVSRDIGSFLKASINVNMASDDDLANIAKNYLRLAAQGARARYRTIYPPLEKHRRQLQDIIYGVMVRKQVISLKSLHHGSADRPECRVHPLLSYKKDLVSLTTTLTKQADSPQESALPQIRSDVEGLASAPSQGLVFIHGVS